MESRSHSKQRRKEYRGLQRERIVQAYLNHRINANNAIDRLSRTSGSGLLTAGEIALQAAYKSRSIGESLHYFHTAEHAYRRVVDYAVNVPGKIDLIPVKAQVRLDHMPIDMLMVNEHRLPPRKLAENVYRNILDKAIAFVRDFEKEDNREDLDGKKAASGFIGEMALLSLGFWIPLTTPGLDSDNWLMSLAQIKDDRRNTHGSSVDHAVDVLGWTQVDPEEDITLMYQIQVKNAPPEAYESPLPPSPGNILIYLDPALRLPKYDCANNMGCQIVKECSVANGAPGAYPAIEDRLSRRAELLLDILG